jgi:3-phenylpropionate/trans-cinnamate dioxygenase ferredoxin reductase component
VAPGAVVIGASMGGLRAAEQLRAAGWTGPITVIGAEPYAPYNRPPLTKALLRSFSVAKLDTRTAHRTLAFRRRPSVDDVSWRLGRTVTSVCVDDRTIRLDDGEELTYEGLVVATGLRPRRLPLRAPLEDRHVIRSLDDAAALGQVLAPGARVVVIGAGFIGCEVAATATELGCSVTVIEPLSAPLTQAVGEELGQAVQRVHEANGVRFCLGSRVAAVESEFRRDAAPKRIVELADCTRVVADVVIEAIGSVPNVEFLDGNGLDLGDGVLCDNQLRVAGRPEIVAVGDVARFPNPRFDETPRRVEHWSMPGLMARRAAATLASHLLGTETPHADFDPLPTFWSDQFDLRINSMGAPALADEITVLEGDLGALHGSATGAAVLYQRDQRPVGVVGVGISPERLNRFRSILQPVPSVAVEGAVAR